MSQWTDVGDAIVDHLNSWPFKTDFIALRRLRLYLNQEDPSRVIVVVTPAGVVTTGLTRVEWQEQYDFGISLYWPLQGTVAEEDDLVALLGEDIPHSLIGRPMAGAKMIELSDGGTRAVFNPEAHDESFSYLGTLEVSYMYTVKEQ